MTRQRDGVRQLLVFTHRDYTEAGLQVPAGTVRDGEDPDVAVMREVAEETGLTDITMLGKLGVFVYNPDTGLVNERHVYHLAAPDDTPDRWEWLETGGGEMADHEGYVFLFHWDDLNAPIDLAGNQGDYLRNYELRITNYEPMTSNS